MSDELDRLYAKAAQVKADEVYAGRRNVRAAEELRREYRRIVDEITKINLQRKLEQRLYGDEEEKPKSPRRQRHIGEQWWAVLGVHPHAGRDEVNSKYRKLARKHHPDAGGSLDAMIRINAARDQALSR